MVVFTIRKIEREKLSSKIYSNVGLPTVNNFKHVVPTRIISNFPILVTYISNSKNIYGPLMSILKVNFTRRKPRLVIKDCTQISSAIYKKNSKIELLIDAIYINGIVFLISIDRQLKYISIIHIVTQNEEHFSSVLTKSFASIIQQD